MKKHELIKAAYDNYPDSTKIYSTSGNGQTHTTKIPYCIDEYGSVQDSFGWLIYNNHYDRWAIPVKESILSGKCAIAVNNEREFKLLMGHYDSKGWLWASKNKPHRVTYKSCEKSHSKNLTYEDGFSWWSDDYNIIPFKDFAAEVGIKVPVFVMNSEDGVPLYVGDKIHRAWWSLFDNKWRYDNCKLMDEYNAVITGVDQAKAFSTKEAAEAWIKENNKPKSVNINLFNSGSSAQVSKDVIMLNIDGYHLGIKPSDLEDMLHAYKSLQ